jgi:protein-S-isoprenylcysteine O-methyltransferase
MVEATGLASPAYGPKGAGRAAATGFGLGLVCCGGLWICATDGWGMGNFGFYALALALFHALEHQLVAAYRPDTLSFDSFCINHSMAYSIAAALSWAEFLVEKVLLGYWCGWGVLPTIGALLVVAGHAVRFTAMVTAGQNFSHIIETGRKRQAHQLVEHGVYRYLRHPAYFGWFWWSIGTQLLLCNPLCTGRGRPGVFKWSGSFPQYIRPLWRFSTAAQAA